MIELTNDTYWPVCATCNQASGLSFPTRIWCEHVADEIRNNRDTLPTEDPTQAEPMPHIAVPFLPQQGVFAEVGWDAELYPGARMMYLVRRLPGWNDVDFNKEYLGMWNSGERRASICLTVRDWAAGEGAGRLIACPDTGHGYKEAMEVGNLDRSQIEVNNFYVFTEGCCFFCYQKIAKGVGINSADNFLDPADGPNPDTLAAARERLKRTGTPF